MLPAAETAETGISSVSAVPAWRIDEHLGKVSSVLAAGVWRTFLMRYACAPYHPGRIQGSLRSLSTPGKLMLASVTGAAHGTGKSNGAEFDLLRPVNQIWRMSSMQGGFNWSLAFYDAVSDVDGIGPLQLQF
jgi:hypothetical protein